MKKQKLNVKRNEHQIISPSKENKLRKRWKINIQPSLVIQIPKKVEVPFVFLQWDDSMLVNFPSLCEREK